MNDIKFAINFFLEVNLPEMIYHGQNVTCNGVLDGLRVMLVDWPYMIDLPRIQAACNEHIIHRELTGKKEVIVDGSKTDEENTVTMLYGAKEIGKLVCRMDVLIDGRYLSETVLRNQVDEAIGRFIKDHTLTFSVWYEDTIYCLKDCEITGYVMV